MCVIMCVSVLCLQLELLGQSVYEFVHPCDQEELRDLLAPRPGGSHCANTFGLQTFVLNYIQLLLS